MAGRRRRRGPDTVPVEVVDPSRARVAHLGPDVEGPGGMARAVQTLRDSPLRRRYDIDLITTYRHDQPIGRLFVFGRSLLTLTRWCAGAGPRVVHLHATVRGSLHRKAILLAIAKLMRRPVILHFHAGPGDISAFHARLGAGRLAVFRAVFRAADHVVTVSQAGAAELEARFGRDDITVVRNAVRPPVNPLPTPTDGATGILYIGGFADPAKGGEIMVAAVPGIQMACPDAHVVMAGPGHPPPASEPVLRRQGVRWVGLLDRASTLQAIDDCAVFVLPSLSEGLPLALLEAMSRGKAILATRVGGIPEIADDGVELVLVEPGRKDLLIEGVCRLLAEPQTRARLGAAARTRTVRLNAEEVYAPLAHLYDSLIRQRGS